MIAFTKVTELADLQFAQCSSFLGDSTAPLGSDVRAIASLPDACPQTHRRHQVSYPRPGGPNTIVCNARASTFPRPLIGKAGNTTSFFGTFHAAVSASN